VLVAKRECRYQKLRENLVAARSSVFNKLEGVEPQVTQALVVIPTSKPARSATRCECGTASDVAGYRTKILEGNHLSGTEHRLQEMRTERAAALPGKSLVVLDPRCGAIQDMFRSRTEPLRNEAPWMT